MNHHAEISVSGIEFMGEEGDIFLHKRMQNFCSPGRLPFLLSQNFLADSRHETSELASF